MVDYTRVNRARRRPRRATSIAASLLALAFTTAACTDSSSDSADGSTNEGGQHTDLEIALIPISVIAPAMLAIEKGYFEQEDLTVKPRMISEGPAIVPAVVSGDVDLGFAGMPSIIKAWDQGLDVQLIAVAEQGPEDAEDDPTRLMVDCDGPIEEAADLEGEEVAVGALGGTDHLIMNAALTNAGADIDKITLVEIPFANQPQSLESGEVTAIAASEPFNTIAEEQGACELMPMYSMAGSALPVAGYFASNEFIDSHPDAVEGFVRAIDNAQQDAIANPDEVRDILPTYTDMSEELASDVPLPGFPTREFTTSDISTFAELMHEYSDYSGETDLDGLLWP